MKLPLTILREPLLILVLLIGFFGGVSAQPSGQDTLSFDIYDLSLKDLAQVKIKVASKKSEDAQDAPGSVTAYSASTMDELGYYTLRDLASITPGYSSFRGIGEITFETRGQKSDGFDNNKHLILIDGIPFSHARANKANAEEDLPLFMASQVEFMRGPGSSLYGMSAFYGVINITTPDLKAFGTKGRVKSSIGSYDLKRRVMGQITHKNEDGITKLSLGYFGKDAGREFLGNGNIQNFNSRNFDNRKAFFGYFSHEITTGALKGLTQGTIISSKTGGLGDFWMNQQNQNYEFNEITWEQLVYYSKYKRTIVRNLEYEGYFKWNMSTEKAYVGGYQVLFSNDTSTFGSVYNIRVHDLELSNQVNWDLNEKGEITGAVVLVSRFNPGSPETYTYSLNSGPGITFVPNAVFFPQSSRYNMYSAWAQYQNLFPVLRGLSITAGVRSDLGRVLLPQSGEISNAFNAISPRLSLVQKFHPNLSLKLLYGEAMRPPLLKEVGINEEFITENPEFKGQIADITAEENQTLEFLIQWKSKRLLAQGTVFMNRTTNTITKVTPPGTTNQITANVNGIENGHGFELDAHLGVADKLRLGSNFAYAKVQQPNEQGDIYNVPVSKLNHILTYSVSEKRLFTIALISKWVTAYRLGGVTSWGDYENQTIEGHRLLDANLRVGLTQRFVLEVQALNVFNKNYRTPAFFASGELNVPGAGRSFLFSMDISF